MIRLLYLTPVFVLLCFHLTKAQPVVVDRVVAVAGKEVILLSDLAAQVQSYAYNNRVDPSMEGLEQDVLRSMIDERLIMTKALEDTTISVTDEEVTAEIDATISQIVQSAGSEARVEEMYGMPINKLRREQREYVRKRLFAIKLQQAKLGNLTVARREVQEFFEMFKDSLPPVPEEFELYHIVRIPSVSSSAKERVKQKAKSILDSIKSGAREFEDFARRYSDDKGSGAHGGDLGFVRRGVFVKDVEEALFSLKDNEIGDLVESVFGIHIIQLLERRGESVHARHILFKIDRDSGVIRTTVDFLNALVDSFNMGESFAELAKRHSEDKETGPLGGFLGRFTVDRLDESLQQTVKGLNAGQVSKPSEITRAATKAYHIVWVKKRVPGHPMNLEDDWNRIQPLAISHKQNRLYSEWVAELRKEIYWESRL